MILEKERIWLRLNDNGRVHLDALCDEIFKLQNRISKLEILVESTDVRKFLKEIAVKHEKEN